MVHSYGRVLVAYSGGADSAFLLKICRDVLGKENVLAVIAKSASLPASELRAARETAEEIDAQLLEIETDELENPNYRENAPDRCYFCKGGLYARLVPIAESRGLHFILNGTHRDDLGEWRPGNRAAEAYRVKSPLAEAGIGKEEVREFSRQIGLSTWSKPQAACLSSRIPFGTEVTVEKLAQVEAAEEILKELGFKVVRVRWPRDGEPAPLRALIEVGPDEVSLFFHNREIRESVLIRLKKLGFDSVAVDPEGYRPGRFNPRIQGGPSLRVPPEGRDSSQ